MLPTIFIAQYFVLVATGLAMMTLIGYMRPFKEVNRNRVELFDEAFILFFMYHIFCFTDFVPNLSTRRFLGYSAISWMLFYMLSLYSFLVYSTIKGLIKQCRLYSALKTA